MIRVCRFYDRIWKSANVAVSKECMTGSENGVYGVRVLGHFKAMVGERVENNGF